MYSLILAGGSGTRFWPASRASLPKQFLKVFGEKTLLQQTVERVAPLLGHNDTYVVVNDSHEAIARQQLETSKCEILSEPTGRNTAACIGLAAVHMARRHPDEPVVVMPSDHHIGNEEIFRRDVAAAAEHARSGSIVVLGVTPTRPETGYGYIRMDRSSAFSTNEPIYSVEQFVEKPDLHTALAYLSEGSYVWNTGIFAATPRTILYEIQNSRPDLYGHLQEIGCAIGTADYSAVLRRVYPQIENISIDYAVMEHALSSMYVMKTDIGWSDIGSWRSLYDLRPQSHDDDGNLFHGAAVTLESRNNLLYSNGGRTISLLGVDDLVVVDTEDTLFISRMDRSQDVGRMVGRMREAGRADLC